VMRREARPSGETIAATVISPGKEGCDRVLADVRRPAKTLWLTYLRITCGTCGFRIADESWPSG